MDVILILDINIFAAQDSGEGTVISQTRWLQASLDVKGHTIRKVRNDAFIFVTCYLEQVWVNVCSRYETC